MVDWLDNNQSVSLWRIYRHFSLVWIMSLLNDLNKYKRNVYKKCKYLLCKPAEVKEREKMWPIIHYAKQIYFYFQGPTTFLVKVESIDYLAKNKESGTVLLFNIWAKDIFKWTARVINNYIPKNIWILTLKSTWLFSIFIFNTVIPVYYFSMIRL